MHNWTTLLIWVTWGGVIQGYFSAAKSEWFERNKNELWELCLQAYLILNVVVTCMSCSCEMSGIFMSCLTWRRLSTSLRISVGRMPGSRSVGGSTMLCSSSSSCCSIFTFEHLIWYNFLAKCQYNCSMTVLWCPVHSSHIHTNPKTSLNQNTRHQTSR